MGKSSRPNMAKQLSLDNQNGNLTCINKFNNFFQIGNKKNKYLNMALAHPRNILLDLWSFYGLNVLSLYLYVVT